MKSILIIKPTWFDFSFNNYHAHCYTNNSAMTILVAAGLQLLGAFSSVEDQCLPKGAFSEGSYQLKNTTLQLSHIAHACRNLTHAIFSRSPAKFDFADVRLICQITNNYFKLYFNSVIKVCIYMPQITNIWR